MSSHATTAPEAHGHRSLQHHFENMEQQREAGTLGAVNTGVVIFSSFTMAMAVYFTQVGKQRPQVICLMLTLILGLAFLGIKSVEYKSKWDDHLIPGRLFAGNPFNPTVAQHGD